MHLWIVRHAIAADRAPDSDDDALRPLTPEGRVEFRQFAKWLNRRVKIPELICASPLLRAQQTAEILCNQAGRRRKDVVTAPVMMPGVSLERLIEYLSQQSVTHVAVVGHEPDLSRLASTFVGGAEIQFDKGTIACIEFTAGIDAGQGQLCWYLSPRM